MTVNCGCIIHMCLSVVIVVSVTIPRSALMIISLGWMKDVLRLITASLLSGIKM